MESGDGTWETNRETNHRRRLRTEFGLVIKRGDIFSID